MKRTVHQNTLAKTSCTEGQPARLERVDSDRRKLVTLYHNPRCSKSRQTLQLLEARGLKLNIVEYLKTPPSAATLKAILKKLGIKPHDLLRRGEARYAELGLKDRELSDEALIALMVENPILIERPIVVNGNKAAIGRPPEKLLEIL